MANLTKNPKHSNIESNIKKAFEVIDDYLPKRYADRAKTYVPECSSNYIRHVRCVRKGPLKVVMALKKVALEEKKILS